MDRLLREGDPPVGQIASPKPQYKERGTTGYAPVEGQHGAPFAALVDVTGTPITPASADDIETLKTELGAVKDELALIKTNQTSGDQKVALTGRTAVTETVVNALAITDTQIYKYPIDMSIIEKSSFCAFSSLNQPVILCIRPTYAGGDYPFFGEDGETMIFRTTIQGNKRPHLIGIHSPGWESLNDVAFGEVYLAVVCSTAPTSGSVSVIWYKEGCLNA